MLPDMTLVHYVLKYLEQSGKPYNVVMRVRDILRERLVELREENDWTQKEVASRLNISQRTYSHYENGSRQMSIEMLLAVSELYGVSIDSLVRK